MNFSELPPEGFRKVSEDNQEHHRVFDPVEIGPENPQKGEEPYLVPFKFQDVEKNDDEKVGKEVRSHSRFPVENHDRTCGEKEKAEQQFIPVFTPTNEEKTDKKDGQKIEE
ncbi:MAG: hypothetical protein KKH85_06555, partial [Proteobacteria bacterium]|nr:hypothetical protein [Pseudomonadota bacterium]